MENNCFSVLCWFLLYISMNQSYYTSIPSLLNLSPTLHPIYPIPPPKVVTEHWFELPSSYSKLNWKAFTQQRKLQTRWKTTLRMGENNSKWNNWQRINLQNIQAFHEAQYHKNKQPRQKVGRRPKQTFLQIRHLCNTMDCSLPAPPSTEFSRQEYWSELLFPTPGIFLTQGTNLGVLQCRQILYHLSLQGSPKNPYWWLINTWKDAKHCSLLEKCKSNAQWGITSPWEK